MTLYKWTLPFLVNLRKCLSVSWHWIICRKCDFINFAVIKMTGTIISQCASYLVHELTGPRIDWPQVGLSVNCPVGFVMSLTVRCASLPSCDHYFVPTSFLILCMFTWGYCVPGYDFAIIIIISGSSMFWKWESNRQNPNRMEPFFVLAENSNRTPAFPTLEVMSLLNRSVMSTVICYYNFLVPFV